MPDAIPMHNSKFDVTDETEFCFWGFHESTPDDRAGKFEASQSKTDETEAWGGEAGVAGSPLVWLLMENGEEPDSKVQPCRRRRCNMSSNSRTQAMADGRKQLMETVEDWSEWNLELSLQDIVEEKGPDEKQSDITREFTQQREMKANQTYRSGKMARMESMDRENFLLKMFFPSFRHSNRKNGREERGSEFCLIPKLQDPTKFVGTESWTQRQILSVETQNPNSKKKGTGRRIKDAPSFGCCPFFLAIRGRNRSSSFLEFNK